MPPVPEEEQRRSLKYRRDQLKRYEPEAPSPLRISRSCSTAADEDDSQPLKLRTDSMGRFERSTPVPSESKTDSEYPFEEIWPSPESSRHSLQVNAHRWAYSDAPADSVDKEQEARNDRASHCENRPGMPDFDNSSWSVRDGAHALLASQPSCKRHSDEGDSIATLPSDQSGWPMKQTREVEGETSELQPSTEQHCGDTHWEQPQTNVAHGKSVEEQVLLLQFI